MTQLIFLFSKVGLGGGPRKRHVLPKEGINPINESKITGLKSDLSLLENSSNVRGRWSAFISLACKPQSHGENGKTLHVNSAACGSGACALRNYSPGLGFGLVPERVWSKGRAAALTELRRGSPGCADVTSQVSSRNSADSARDRRLGRQHVAGWPGSGHYSPHPSLARV